MKPLETTLDKKKRQHIVMWLALLYGGFAIILFGMDLYSMVWFGSAPFLSEGQRISDRNETAPTDSNHMPAFERPQMGFIRAISSPSSIMVLASGLISLAAGVTIWRITREKEIKKIRQEAADYLLLPDEKKVIDVLKHGNYALPQNKITKESGLSKVQVHRVLKRLEAKGLIEKHEYGLTNKIILKKELFE